MAHEIQVKNIEYKILLTKDKFSILDADDFEWLSQWKWHYHIRGYAVRAEWDKSTKKQKTIRMHRIIMKCPDNMQVDHINGNRLDNRKSNLRLCTLEQNSKNRRINISQKKTSDYKGVDKFKDKWRARITCGNMRIFIGLFYNEEDAALAYNFIALKSHGDFAKFNSGAI